MNTSIARRSFIALTISCAFFASCKKTDDIKAGPETKVFHPEIFRQNLVAALGNHPIGYALAINHEGKLVDSALMGYARMPQDGGVKHTLKNVMNIASVTKYLTAICVVKVLQEKGISPDSPIYPYLPSFWKPSAGAKAIKFHDLLRHRSGLTTDDIRYATDYQGLKDCIEKPIANPAKGYNYSNVNFALFRIMMAYIHDKPHALSTEATHMANGDTLNLHKFLTLYYAGRMDENVFKPAGVSNATTAMADRSQETLMYSATNTALGGAPAGDWTFKCGGGGYFMSPYDLAKILAYVSHSDKIVTTAQRLLMETNYYGFDGSACPATAHGQGYGKEGGLGVEANGLEGTQAGDPGLQTLTMKLPAGVEVVLFINSLGDGYRFDYPAMVKTAFEGAWK